MTRILFIAHYFPPIGGAGVQRTTKFLKHLPSLGVDPVILTGLGGSTSRWEPQESSLNLDLPPDLKVYRADWKEDSARRVEALVSEGGRAIRENKPSAILVTMSPFEDAEVAARLASSFRLPWIADLRDPWALDEFQVYRSRWHRNRELERMRRSLRSAARIIMNTPEAAQRFRVCFPDLAAKASAITNGYDADDFDGPIPQREESEFRIVHTGYLHTEQGARLRARKWMNRILGRTIPGVDLLPRSHVFLIKALERWSAEDPRVVGKVRLLLAGVNTPLDREVVDCSDVAGLVTFLGFVPHDESVALIRSADLLFLPMHGMAPGARATIVPGKTYEYMATGRPILAAVPHGDAEEFLKGAGTAKICRPDDVNGILSGLKVAFRSWETGENAPELAAGYLAGFERGRLATKLAEVVSEVCGVTSGRSGALR